MPKIKLSRKQVAIIKAIRSAGRMINQNGYVPSSVACEICYLIYGYTACVSRIMGTIETFNPLILFTRPRDLAVVSRRAPMESEIDTDTPEANVIINEQLAQMITVRLGIVIGNIPRDRPSVFKSKK